MKTTGTTVTNNTTNSTIVETHESKLIFVTNVNSNLRETIKSILILLLEVERQWKYYMSTKTAITGQSGTSGVGQLRNKKREILFACFLHWKYSEQQFVL